MAKPAKSKGKLARKMAQATYHPKATIERLRMNRFNRLVSSIVKPAVVSEKGVV